MKYKFRTEQHAVRDRIGCLGGVSIFCLPVTPAVRPMSYWWKKSCANSVSSNVKCPYNVWKTFVKFVLVNIVTCKCISKTYIHFHMSITVLFWVCAKFAFFMWFICKYFFFKNWVAYNKKTKENIDEIRERFITNFG